MLSPWAKGAFFENRNRSRRIPQWSSTALADVIKHQQFAIWIKSVRLPDVVFRFLKRFFLWVTTRGLNEISWRFTKLLESWIRSEYPATPLTENEKPPVVRVPGASIAKGAFFVGPLYTFSIHYFKCCDVTCYVFSQNPLLIFCRKKLTFGLPHSNR